MSSLAPGDYGTEEFKPYDEVVSWSKEWEADDFINLISHIWSTHSWVPRWLESLTHMTKHSWILLSSIALVREPSLILVGWNKARVLGIMLKANLFLVNFGDREFEIISDKDNEQDLLCTQDMLKPDATNTTGAKDCHTEVDSDLLHRIHLHYNAFHFMVPSGATEPLELDQTTPEMRSILQLDSRSQDTRLTLEEVRAQWKPDYQSWLNQLLSPGERERLIANATQRLFTKIIKTERYHREHLPDYSTQTEDPEDSTTPPEGRTEAPIEIPSDTETSTPAVPPSASEEPGLLAPPSENKPELSPIMPPPDANDTQGSEPPQCARQEHRA